MLGFDPLYVANEGKLLAFVPAEKAEAVPDAMRSHPLDTESIIIGEVVAHCPGSSYRGFAERGDFRGRVFGPKIFLIRSCGRANTLFPSTPVIVSAATIALSIASSVA